MTGTRLSNVAGWIMFVLVIAGIFTGHVWKQNHYVRLQRDSESARVQLMRLKSDIASIQLDNKKLKDYKRLEKLGLEKFSLVYTSVPEFIYQNPQQEKNGK